MDKVVMISKTPTARGLFLKSKVILADIFVYIYMHKIIKKEVHLYADNKKSLIFYGCVSKSQTPHLIIFAIAICRPQNYL